MADASKCLAEWVSADLMDVTDYLAWPGKGSDLSAWGTGDKPVRG